MRPSSPPSSPEDAPQVPRVLVVDDDRFVLEVLSRILRQAGYEVKAVSDGEAALEAVTACRPDLVLLDVMMPGVHGLDVCREVKRLSGRLFLPVLFLTARDDMETKVAGFSAGGDDYITKPFASAEVLARIQAMLRLRTAQRRILELEARKNELLDIVTHDMKLPVSIIVAFCRHLMERTEPLPPDAQDIVGRISANAEFMERLIGFFLGRGILEKGEIVLRPTRTRIARILELCVHRTAAAAGGKDLIIACDLPEPLPVLYVDEHKISQVVNNLLSNAIKFSPPGGKITLGCRLHGDAVVVEVTDEGPGVRPEDRRKIFEKFVQSGQKPSSAGGEGTGLGLAICKKLVSLHGGDIWMEPRPEGGSAFRFRLPLSLEAPDGNDTAGPEATPEG